MRRECCVYDSSEIESVSVIKDFPIYCGQTDESEYETMDLDFGISKNGTIQIKSLVDLNKLYKYTHNDAIGKTWEEHFSKLSQFLNPHVQNKDVFEFGGGSCKVFHIIKDQVKHWTTLDFNPTNQKHDKMTTIVGNVVDGFQYDYDVYFSSHFLEHLYEPYLFLENFRHCKKGTKHIFSIPNQKEWLSNGYANALFFEHSVILEEEKIIQKHNQHGFVMVDRMNFSDHSIFYCFEKISDHNVFDKIDTYDENVKMLNHYLSILKGDYFVESKFYIFSAHIQSQCILKMNSFRDLCVGVLDNSPLKIGKKLYGFDLDVFDPKEADRDIRVLLPKSSYSNEIKKQLNGLGYKDVF